MDVAITIDVEAHRVRSEISDETSDSLGDILAALRAHGIRATLFVDLCEVPTWGDEFMRGVCRRILDAGHDLQLHAHPHHVTKDPRRWLLSEYSRDEQAAVLDYAIERYVAYVGKRPTAFRAGGFGADVTTVELLRERGFTIDASLMRGAAGCKLPDPVPGAPTELAGLHEVPLTPVVILGSKRRPLRTMAIDFNWMPLFALKRTLRALRKSDPPVVTLLMHSSSLCVRIGSSRMPYRPRLHRKLLALLDWLRAEKFHMTALDEVTAIPQAAKAPSEIMYVETNPVLQYVNLLYRSFVGATFKPKFAMFLAAHVVAVLAGLAVLAWYLA